MGEDTKTFDIELEPQTVLLDTNVICWYDLMYRTLTLNDGETLDIPVFFPEDLDIKALNINVRLEESVIEGESIGIYVCEIPVLGEIHYVDKSGRLQGVKIPEKDVTIELAYLPTDS